jgi:hypothetical protein
MFWIKALFGLLCIFGVCRLAHHTTEGFRISKIQNNTFENTEFQTLSFSQEEEKRAKEILSQPFTYLARGKQSFVFVSEDQKTVLKLLNNHYQWQIQPIASSRTSSGRRRTSPILKG